MKATKKLKAGLLILLAVFIVSALAACGNHDVPQAVLSFLKEYDLSGKIVVPFCTHDGYGAG